MVQRWFGLTFGFHVDHCHHCQRVLEMLVICVLCTDLGSKTVWQDVERFNWRAFLVPFWMKLDEIGSQ